MRRCEDPGRVAGGLKVGSVVAQPVPCLFGEVQPSAIGPYRTQVQSLSTYHLVQRNSRKE